MLYYILVPLLAFVLTMMVAGNNLSAAVGTLIGSRILSRAGGALIGAAGFSIGLIVQGRSLHGTASSLLPDNNMIVSLALLVSLIIFIMATVLRVPLSLIMALVGSSIGLSLRYHFQISSSLVLLIIFTWVLAPFLSVAMAYIINRRFSRMKPKNVWNFALTLKIALIIISFLTAFTLGANTLGFIAEVGRIKGYEILLLVIAIFLGSFILSGGVVRRVGNDMYTMRYSNAFVSLLVSSALVEGATLFGIPLSNTQTLTSSVFGSGLSYRLKFLEARAFYITVGMWILSPVLGIILGFIA
ncbi:MAG: anion permease [Candidatus Thermoplasmatota archaeon]|nr:anion permease [Candidatus Thermoplasmatota archaeon]